MDIHRNPRISKWISIKAWTIGNWIHKNMDIHSWIFIASGYPLQNVLAWISLLGY